MAFGRKMLKVERIPKKVFFLLFGWGKSDCMQFHFAGRTFHRISGHWMLIAFYFRTTNFYAFGVALFFFCRDERERASEVCKLQCNVLMWWHSFFYDLLKRFVVVSEIMQNFNSDEEHGTGNATMLIKLSATSWLRTINFNHRLFYSRGPSHVSELLNLLFFLEFDWNQLLSKLNKLQLLMPSINLL